MSIRNLVLLAVLALLPASLRADLIPTALQPVAELPADQASERLPERLNSLGLTPHEASERVAQLAPDEVAALAANPEQVQVGGLQFFGLGKYATVSTLLVIGGLFVVGIVLNAIFRFL
ncbi:MAG: hypothetical protein HYZ53_00640 [Planctomycetes bacterium]|nr:hypothetical protein [Planctomycetota bacterium]